MRSVDRCARVLVLGLALTMFGLTLPAAPTYAGLTDRLGPVFTPTPTAPPTPTVTRTPTPTRTATPTPTPTAGEDNLAPNPSFETGTAGPDGWYPGGIGAGVSAAWDAEVSRTGSKSVSISVDFAQCVGGIPIWNTVEDITLDPPKSYLFEAWARQSSTGETPGYIPAGLGLQLLDADGATIGQKNAPITALGDWTRLELWLDWPQYRSGVARVRLWLVGPVPYSCDSEGSATVWFDDVFFGPRQPPQLAGDADCDGRADSRDAYLVLRFSAGLENSMPVCDGVVDEYHQLMDDDVNGDYQLDPVDALLILQYEAGLIGGSPNR